MSPENAGGVRKSPKNGGCGRISPGNASGVRIAGRPLRCPKPARKPSRRLVPALATRARRSISALCKVRNRSHFHETCEKAPRRTCGCMQNFHQTSQRKFRFSPYAWLTHFRSSAAYDASCRAHRQGPWPPRGQLSAASCRAIARNAARGTPSTPPRPSATNALSPAQKRRINPMTTTVSKGAQAHKLMVFVLSMSLTASPRSFPSSSLPSR